MSTCFFSMKPQIESYNPQWSVMFEDEKALLENVKFMLFYLFYIFVILYF